MTNPLLMQRNLGIFKNFRDNKKMKGFFNSWLAYAQQHTEVEESISHLISFFHMGRRRDFRVHYPPWGDLDYLPQVILRGEHTKVHDISMGGLGLVSKGSEIAGNSLNIKLKWPREGLTFQTRVRTIANYKESSHLQFEEMGPMLERQLQSCLLPRLLGQRFQLVKLTNTPFKCIEEEVWISPQSEALLIQKDFGLFRIAGEEIHIERNQGIFLKSPEKRIPIQEPQKIAQLLICLASIPNATRHLATLQDYIYNFWKQLSANRKEAHHKEYLNYQRNNKATNKS